MKSLSKLAIFKVAILVLLVGVAWWIYAEINTSIDAKGIVHETLATPLSITLIGVGVLLLIASIIIYYKKKK